MKLLKKYPVTDSRTSAQFFKADKITPVMSIDSIETQIGTQRDEDDFVIALIPDTQVVTESYPSILSAMFDWIVAQKTTLNIQAVAALGDQVNQATDGQFAQVLAEFDKVKAAGMRYCMVPGNHDYDEMNTAYTRTCTKWDTNFPPSYWSGKAWYGGEYNSSTTNSYITFDVGTHEFLILCLEIWPRPEVLTWAQGIMDANTDKEVIIVTHGYIDLDGHRAVHGYGHGPDDTHLYYDSDGQQMWNDFIRSNENIFAVFSGHFFGLTSAYSTDVNDAGKTVHQFIYNYQGETNGGNGAILLAKFRPRYGTVELSVYQTNLSAYEPTGARGFQWAPIRTNSITTAGVISSGDTIQGKRIHGTQPLVVAVDGSTNTGTDETHDNTYEAIKFTATANVDIASLSVRLKASALLTNPTQEMWAYLYTDNAGVPGTALGGYLALKFGAIGTTYSEFQFPILLQKKLMAGTSYWIVLKRTAAPTGGNIIFDSTNTGTAQHAYSANGSAWTTENSKQGWYKLHTINDIALVGYSGNNIGVLGMQGYLHENPNVVSTIANLNVAGVAGISPYGYGVFGHSRSTYGIYGKSDYDIGIYGYSQYRYGGQFESVSGVAALRAIGTTAMAALLSTAPSSLGTVVEVVRVQRISSGTTIAGVGGGIDYYIQNGSGSAIQAARISAILSAVTAAHENGRIAFSTVNDGAVAEKVTIDNVGAVGISQTAPNAASLLDIVSTTKGVLLPRMTTEQRNAIVTPPEGLELYDLTLHLKIYYNGSVWKDGAGNTV